MLEKPAQLSARTPLQRLGLQRRRLVKRAGKRLLRRLDGWLSRQSRVPDQPVLDPALFPWSEELRSHWKQVRSELDALLRHREQLPRFQDISPDQYKISPDDRWRTFLFCGFGKRSEQARRLCPQTARLLDRIPGLETAFFSILAPGMHVPRHRGVTKALLRCHLALRVPDAAERCHMSVGDLRCAWREGETLFFDDTTPHEVHNEADQERAVLLIDFARPMRLPGRLASRLLTFGLRQTRFFKDADANQTAWEERFREHLEREA